jgi:hypothetical protein
VLFFREVADDVLHHHHRAVHDQPEVDRAEAHQGSRHAGPQHEIESHEHRERNRGGDDQPLGAKLAREARALAAVSG